MNCTIIQIYAPTFAADEENVKEFFGKFQELVEQVTKEDVSIIMGDWNTKIGEAGALGIAGKHGLGIHNEQGKRMLEFCVESYLIIANT